MLQFHRFRSNFLRKWFQQLLCTETVFNIFQFLVAYWYLIFGIVLISRPSSWMIQNTNSLNWEKIFCFAKEFTKVTWHLRHGGFNRIRQLIFHDYMSYRKINCTMPAKQTPHVLTTPYIKGPWKLFIFHHYPPRGKNEIFQFVSPGWTVVFRAVWSNVTMCRVTPGICHIFGRAPTGDSTKVEMK